MVENPWNFKTAANFGNVARAQHKCKGVGVEVVLGKLVVKAVVVRAKLGVQRNQVR